MKRVMTILLAIAFVIALAGCSGPGTGVADPNAESQQPSKASSSASAASTEAAQASSPAASAGAKKDVTIVVVPQQLGNVVFLPAKEGAEKAAKELGIKVEWMAPVKAEAPLQVEVIEGLIERKVDGIAISCNHPDALKDVLARAVSEGIKVSTFDADSPNSGRIFYAGTENYQAGVTCGKQMIELFKDSKKDKINIAQLEGIPGAFDIEARKKGFADTIKGSKLEVVFSGPCDDDVDKAVNVVEDYTRANGKNIDAWFMAGGWPYIVKPEALPELKKWRDADPQNRKVVTMDIFPTSRAHFDLNLIDVAVGQSFEQMGYLSVVNLYKSITGETVKGDTKEGIPGLFIDTGTQIVTPANYKTEIAEQKG